MCNLSSSNDEIMENSLKVNEDDQIGIKIPNENNIGKHLERDYNDKIANLIDKSPKIRKIIAQYLEVLKWSDFGESGKKKIIDLIRSDACYGVSCRVLEHILPCSKSSISNYRNMEAEDMIENINNHQVGRPSKLTKEQESELMGEAMLLRKQFQPISLKWAIDFIFKRHSLTVSKSIIRRTFAKYGWKKRKAQKRHPKSEPKNKKTLIYLFQEYVYGYIRKHNLSPSNVHIMDETAIYSNSIVPYTYTYKDDKEAYVITSESCVKDTFIATLTAYI